MSLIVIAVFSFSLSVVLVYLTRLVCLRYGILDRPNERSSHTQPVALMGGIGFIVSGLLSLCLFFPALVTTYPLLLSAFLCLVGVSIADDIWTVPSGVRLLFHIAVGIAVYVTGLGLDTLVIPFGALVFSIQEWVSAGFTVFYVVSWINVYNFMDGMDGYAAMMAVFGFGCLAYISAQQGGELGVTVLLLLASVVAGFWVWNYPKAKLFMGDVGSATLGGMVALVGLWLNQQAITGVGGVLLWQSLFVFSVFWMDASVTLLRRVIKKEAFWQAHRDHFYQRLLRCGWSHQRVLWLEMTHVAILCVLLCNITSTLLLSAVWLILFLGKYIGCEYFFVKTNKKK